LTLTAAILTNKDSFTEKELWTSTDSSAEKYQKVYLTAFIWIPMFLEHNFKWGLMFFFDPADGAAEPYKVFNTLPEDQRPTKMGLLMEDSADGKIIGDLVAGSAKNLDTKSPYGNPWDWEPRISQRRFSNARKRAWMRFSFTRIRRNVSPSYANEGK
jgi:hypothetical protein